MSSSLYEFTVQDIRGQKRKLSEFKGKVLLIVNVASQCGLTPQYEGLQKLYQEYQDQGLEVLGFPANNFGAQEPGTESEIEAFCTTRFDVTFPMFAKMSVKGDDIHPLYQYLTTKSESPGEITWNFQKFLIDREGKVVANIGPKSTPEEIKPMIKELL